MTDAQFLHQVGQRGLPLLVVYLRHRRRLHLRHLHLGVLLRPLVCIDLWDGCYVRIVGEPEPEMGVLRTGGPDELTLDFWPGRVA